MAYDVNGGELSHFPATDGAWKHIWVGPYGQQPYYDAEAHVPVDAQDGDIAGHTPYYVPDADAMRGIRSEGAIRVDTAPATSSEVLRLGDLLGSGSPIRPLAVVDIDNPTELNSEAGGTVGFCIVAYQVSAAGNPATVYMYDSAHSGGASAPWVMAASGGGFWIAVFGRNRELDFRLKEGAKFYLNANSYLIFESGKVVLYANGAAKAAWS